MREELARCCSSAKHVIELIAAVQAGSYNVFTCSIRGCSHEPAVGRLAPDVLTGSEKRLTGYNIWDEEMFSVTREEGEQSLVTLSTLKGALFLPALKPLGCIYQQSLCAKSFCNHVLWANDNTSIILLSYFCAGKLSTLGLWLSNICGGGM